jgi:hypothetical protein
LLGEGSHTFIYRKKVHPTILIYYREKQANSIRQIIGILKRELWVDFRFGSLMPYIYKE